jgi:hypothetical protein
MHRNAEEEVIAVSMADDENAARRRLDGARRSRDLVNTTRATPSLAATDPVGLGSKFEVN